MNNYKQNVNRTQVSFSALDLRKAAQYILLISGKIIFTRKSGQAGSS